VNGDYTPDNVRWANRSIQNKNKRTELSQFSTAELEAELMRRRHG